MKTKYEIPTDDIGSITKILGKDRVGADKSTNMVRADAHRIIINSDPDDFSEMRKRIRESLVRIYGAEYCGLEIADVIYCWAIAFPHMVAEILECMTDFENPLPFKSDPHAGGYIAGLFQAANLVSINDVDDFRRVDEAVYHFLYTAVREGWWNCNGIVLRSYISGRLSNALATYFQGCWNPKNDLLCRRRSSLGGIIRAFKLEKSENKTENPDKNLYWSLANELITKYILTAPVSERHRMVCWNFENPLPC